MIITINHNAMSCDIIVGDSDMVKGNGYLHAPNCSRGIISCVHCHTGVKLVILDMPEEPPNHLNVAFYDDYLSSIYIGKKDNPEDVIFTKCPPS